MFSALGRYVLFINVPTWHEEKRALEALLS
jgi:hypothetical protein